MLLPLDGSEHRWFQDDRWHDLIAGMDDATNEVYACRHKSVAPDAVAALGWRLLIA
ncbi:MAG: hypothetical protein ACRD19_04600 [Terriglobia bacterium]